MWIHLRDPFASKKLALTPLAARFGFDAIALNAEGEETLAYGLR
jgi:hypothetical protein